ncbi:MAG: hypothetical protein ALECFALPRED_006106 [Alectoria fallacina]|uniref:F-box domain-containing protein n=1 Tax=Alectoria fallacina TaxID=1903189 RepID=A0A8H3I752_9LECA|nr:MAG: hypothetical protein ALECFALPRED_006106 [Alectoria fallacina]
MPALFDLPNELLDKIVDQVHPDDIINFSLSRRQIQVLAKNAVSLHLQRKKTYEDIVLHGCHRHENNAHPLRLIRDICMDWRIGEYPKYLTFECCHHPNRYDDAIEDEDKEDTKEYEIVQREDDIFCQTTMQAIQGYIEERATDLGFSKLNRTYLGQSYNNVGTYLGEFDVSAYCSAAKGGNETHEGINRTRGGIREAMLALLLFFIPNLEAICLARSTWGIWHLEEAIEWISFQTLQRSLSVRKPLMNLSQVRFLGYDDDELLYADGQGENFGNFMSFASLPSMRTIYGDFVEGGDIAEGIWKFAPHTSNVTEIILQHSAVKAEYLTELLVGIKALERFTYDYNENLDSGPGAEIHKLIGTLLEHAKHSLEYLAFTGSFGLRDGVSDIHPCKGSLKDFRVLKEVVLDSYVYVDSDSAYPESNPGDSSCGDDPYIIRHLVNLMPSSIETIHLVGVRGTRHVSGLLKNLLEQKGLRLPKFSKLIIGRTHDSPGGEWGRALWAKCEQAGVTLNTYWDRS